MKLSFFVLLLFCSNFTYSQGCSDAGVCSMGHMAAGETDSVNSTIGITISYEIGERYTSISNTTFSFSFSIFKKGQFAFKMPYFIAIGNLGTNVGFGDPIGSFSYPIYTKNQFALSALVGAKLKVNNSDATNFRGLPLPMPYQSSNGTNDILLGVNIRYKKWHLALGYQQVLNRNRNQFLHRSWNSPIADKYFESAALKRGNDLMFRIEKPFGNSISKTHYFLSILSIYRLKKDEIILRQKVVAIEGSSALTINVNFAMTKKINEKINWKFQIGHPIVWRKARPDGLTRFFVLSGGVFYHFD